MSINDRFEKDVKKNKTAGINNIFNPTQTYSEQTLRVLDNIKNKSEEVQLPAKETNITSQTPMFENTRIQAPVKQNFGSKVANFFKVTLPNAIEDTWDDIKEPITGPSLKQVMTEAKISPQMLKEDAQKQKLQLWQKWFQQNRRKLQTHKNQVQKMVLLYRVLIRV